MSTQPSNGAVATLPARVKPPFLRRVRIRNYKSIAFCDVTLEPLTILVGRNASGKSNFLDALAFLRDVLVRGLHHAVKAHGGREAIFHKGSSGECVEIEVEAAGERLRAGAVTFAIAIEAGSRGTVTLASETFQMPREEYGRTESYRVDHGAILPIAGSPSPASTLSIEK